MKQSAVYKIKDSVDLFLCDDKYIMVYYMNTRQKKGFAVNREMIALLKLINGKRNLEDICHIMKRDYNVSEDTVKDTISKLAEQRVISEIDNYTSILPIEDLNRFDRQINYFSEFLGSDMQGVQAQKKLIDSHVVIFGCGAVGGNIAIQLAMSGVRHFTLYDYDIVEHSDLSRHMYFKSQYIGKSKVNALKDELLHIDKRIDVKTIDQAMKPKTDIEEIIAVSDFVVNTLDEPYIGYTAAKISRICVKHNKPHYIGGGFDAHLASTGELIIPHVTPCVECYATHFKEALKDWTPKKHPVKSSSCSIGGLASMTLYSSSFAAIEIVKYIAGLVDFEKNFKVRGEMLFNDMSLTYLNVQKRQDCPVCGSEAKL